MNALVAGIRFPFDLASLSRGPLRYRILGPLRYRILGALASDNSFTTSLVGVGMAGQGP
ncbi:hypothetical protein [Aeromonas caviae]|uniref:hypothetical protein n=1 Tax=Aeromonas caviae TaxID=648 RepID=UPI0038D13F94